MKSRLLVVVALVAGFLSIGASAHAASLVEYGLLVVAILVP